MANYRRVIVEHTIPGKPLGRHVNHDPRSLAYQIRPRASLAVSRSWPLRIGLLDQLKLGSCVGNGSVHQIGCEPIYSTLAALIKAGLILDETLAVKIYGRATEIDPYPGAWTDTPPNDTGTDGLSGAKATQQMGLISGYLHATSLDAMITGLQSNAVMVGVNWYDSFDQPDSNGYVSISPNANVRGGHEFCVRVVDVDQRLFRAPNSWGIGWGDRGEFTFSYDTMDRLLHEDGDVTQFVPVSAPAPTPTDDLAVAVNGWWAAVRHWAVEERHVGDNKRAAQASAALARSAGLN